MGWESGVVWLDMVEWHGSQRCFINILVGLDRREIILNEAVLVFIYFFFNTEVLQRHSDKEIFDPATVYSHIPYQKYSLCMPLY